jgi:hypothetical protein
MAWYRTGTVSVTNGSTTVTGSGTNFVAGAQVGEGFAAPDGRLYEIVTIVSATSLTIGKGYLGSTQTGQTYEIVPTQSLVADLAGQVSTLISDFQSVADEAGEGKFDYGTAVSPGITFTLDQDTGFFHDTNNEIGVSAGGTKVAEFNSGGLSFPSGKGVVGNVDFGGSITLSKAISTGITRTDDTGQLIFRGGSAVSGSGANLSLFGASHATLPNFSVFDSDTILFRPVDASPEFLRFVDGTGTIFNETNADLDFRIESDINTHAFFLQGSDGFTGINTSSPEAPLTVVPGGTSATSIGGRDISYGVNTIVTSGRTGYLCRVGNNFTADGDNAGFQWIYPFDSGGNVNNKVFRSATGATLVDKFWVNQVGSGYFAGNVGIGIASPTAKLEVVGNSMVYGTFSVAAGTTEARSIEIGAGRTGDGASFVDLIGDATYTDFGARFIRSPGVNGNTVIQTRGTGSLALLTQEAGPITMATNNTERMRITEAGQTIIPGGVTLGTAAGVYNAANTLDDYEEGTWTPAFIPATGAFGSITYAFNTGTYTKVGRLVTVTGRIQVSATPPTIGTAGANCYLSGFPFVIASGQGFYGAMSFTFITGWSDSFAPNSAYISQGSSIAVLMKRPVSDNKELVFTPADFISGGANSGLMFTGTYFTN